MADELKTSCATCENHDICKYVESYKEELNKLKTTKHPIFVHTLSCKKYKGC